MLQLPNARSGRSRPSAMQCRWVKTKESARTYTRRATAGLSAARFPSNTGPCLRVAGWRLGAAARLSDLRSEGDFELGGVIERFQRTTPIDRNRGRRPNRASGQRRDARYCGEGELHASAMMATFLALRMPETAGTMVGCVLGIDLRRNAWMLDVHGMRRGISVPRESDQHQPAPEEQPGNGREGRVSHGRMTRYPVSVYSCHQIYAQPLIQINLRAQAICPVTDPSRSPATTSYDEWPMDRGNMLNI